MAPTVAVVVVCTAVLAVGPAAAFTGVGASAPEHTDLDGLWEEDEYGEYEDEYGEYEDEYGDSGIQTAEKFAGILAEFDVPVYDVQLEGETGSLTVGTHYNGDAAILLYEIVVVAAVYTGYVAGAETPPAALIIEVVDGQNVLAQYYIDAEWTVAVQDGTLTIEKFIDLIIQTVQTPQAGWQ